MKQILEMQKAEANTQFFKFIKENYQDWLQVDEDCPIMSHTLFKEKVFPLLEKNNHFFIVIDNLRYDQWKNIEPDLLSNFRVFQEDLYFSILPTATQYSRNAIFSGLMSSEMQKCFLNGGKMIMMMRVKICLKNNF